MFAQADSVTAALRAVRLQQLASWIAALSILVVPIVTAIVVRRRSRGRSRGIQVGLWSGGCLAMLLYVPVAFVFAFCAGGQIGEPGKWRLARALGTPVVAALARYHEARGQYPDSLTRLVPSFLDSASLRAPERSVLRHPFEYRRDSSGYALTVRFVGPAMNECKHTPRSGWTCEGYF